MLFVSAFRQSLHKGRHLNVSGTYIIQDLGVAQSNSRKDWHHQLFHHDVHAVQQMMEKNLGYLDRKYVLQGTNEAGPLTLEFDTKEENYIIICVGLGLNDAICDNTIWTIDGEESICGTEASASANRKFNV